MVNIRLSPEQILYTINHARDDALLVHVDFNPVLDSIWDRVEKVTTVVVFTDGQPPPAARVPIT
jgi:fatty-acyl-CoA synthase